MGIWLDFIVLLLSCVLLCALGIFVLYQIDKMKDTLRTEAKRNRAEIARLESSLRADIQRAAERKD
jgi:hypothetical protein